MGELARGTAQQWSHRLFWKLEAQWGGEARGASRTGGSSVLKAKVVGLHAEGV